MKILFIHQNFPGQYKHLAAALAQQGHDCVALTLRVKEPGTWRGVRLIPYKVLRQTRQSVHPWTLDLDTKITRAESCWRAACQLRDQGFTPDVIIAHNGWGEPMFLRDVWPTARMGIYCELYHLPDYPHVGFDPEFAGTEGEGGRLRLRLKNLNNQIHFDVAQAGISPTAFQADTFPRPFRDRIEVIHDGIDTAALTAKDDARLTLPDGSVITRQDEVITFVNRNLEPYRGYHVFMRALPRLLRERPGAKVLVVGGDQTSYGRKPPEGQTWKQIFIDEVRGQIPDADWARVHFLGRIPYDRFTALLQVSRVHLYLTYPFVLSWSLLEAMSVSGAIVASVTAPVAEVLRHGETARLVDFFDGDALVAETLRLLDNAGERARLGAAARAHVVANYDLSTRCLPRQLDWVNRLAAMPADPLPV
ncbi:glycosyltransferase [Pseudooceanicola aestuarii]|uniref:glycosyltransferase n=1 Tax=Pseudooceanicola aestuarii TaxID=2697319 RepID=UPI0013D134E3|nr:glycosyltransferase [Pseudooceanicola aestuarii]